MPSYSGGGSGEYALMKELAQAARQRWPDARIEFLMPTGEQARQSSSPFFMHFDTGSAKRRNTWCQQKLVELKPDVALFLPKCNLRTLFLCRRLRIRTAQITITPYPFAKTFLPWRFNLVDAHWFLRANLLQPSYSALQRLIAGLSRTDRRCFDTYLGVGQADPAGFSGNLQKIIASPYALFAPGGGGYRIDGKPVAQVYYEAASRFQQLTGMATVLLPGLLNTVDLPSTGPIVAPPLSVAEVVFLMRHAAVVATNGGGMSHQALAAGVPTVVSNLGGADQPDRVRRYGAAGIVEAVAPNPELIADAVVRLTNPERNAALRRRLAELQLVDGIPTMIEGLEDLIASALKVAPSPVAS